MKSVIICDMEGDSEMNKGALDMFGYSKDELVGMGFIFRSRHVIQMFWLARQIKGVIKRGLKKLYLMLKFYTPISQIKDKGNWLVTKEINESRYTN